MLTLVIEPPGVQVTKSIKVSLCVCLLAKLPGNLVNCDDYFSNTELNEPLRNSTNSTVSKLFWVESPLSKNLSWMLSQEV